MIAVRERPSSKSKSESPAWHAPFLAMLPAIREHARISFLGMPPEAREEMIQAVVANAVAAYTRLVELGRGDVAYPSPLARYAVAQVRAGRNVGNRLRIRDAMSEYAQRRKCFCIDRLDHFDAEENQWQEIVIEDRRAGPAEIAACRIDFAAWLRLLPVRLRKIALTLAKGATTSEAARKFGLTAGRVSQLRLWLKESWERFQGEFAAAKQEPLAVAC